MRTTIDLSPDAYLVAKSFAAERKISMSSAVSQLVLGVLNNVPARVTDDDWPSVSVGKVVTVESVRDFLDEDE